MWRTLLLVVAVAVLSLYITGGMDRVIEVAVGVLAIVVGAYLLWHAERFACIARAPYAWFGLTSGAFTYCWCLWGSRASGVFWIVAGILYILGIVDV